MIEGRNGRVYENGKRVEGVRHEETRTPDELKQLRRERLLAHNKPRSSLDPDRNPIRLQLEAHIKLKGPVWAKTDDGKKYIVGRTHEADAWDERRAAEVAEEKRVESIRPLMNHAEAALVAIRKDSSFTVAEVEAAEERLRVARSGNYHEYKKLDAEFRAGERAKLEGAAHQHDDQIRTLAQRRDKLLAEAWKDEEAVPVPAPAPAPVPQTPNLDPARVAIVDEHGRTKIVRRDELE